MNDRIAYCIAALIGCFFLSGCHAHDKQPNLNPSDLTPPGQVHLDSSQISSLQFAKAQQHVLRDWLDVPAQINADANHTVAVYSSYTGRIVSCDVQVGTRVRRGEVLFTINSPDLIQAESSYLGTMANVHLSRLTLQRDHALMNIQEIAQKDLEQAQSDFSTANANAKAARQTLLSMGLSESQIKRLEHSGKVDRVLAITSPMDALVIDRQAQVGLVTQPGSTPAPITLESANQLWIDAALPEDAVGIHPGAPFKAHPLNQPQLLLHGQIVYISYSEDPQSHTLLARAILNHPSAQLHPGMMLNMQIQNGPDHQVLAVPDDAVVHEPDGSTTVWTTQNQKIFVAHQVHTGLSDSGWTEIMDGISPGNIVVTKGAINLSNIIHASGDD